MVCVIFRDALTAVASVQKKVRYGNMTGVFHARLAKVYLSNKHNEKYILLFPPVAKVWQLHTPAISN